MDEPLWHNGHNATCATYMQSAMCVNGALAPSASWASGAAFNWPERNCCGCGLAAALTASPPPPIGDGATTHGYTLHLGTYCRGADRTTKKDSAGACEAHASSRKVACAHFGGGVCRFTYTFLGLLKAESSGFQSFVRPGAADDKAALKAAAAEEAKAKAALTASVSPLQACGPPTPRVPPSFYMYDGPEFMWGERLAACYATKFGRSPWSMPTLGERGMPVRRSNSSDAAAGDSIFLPAAAVRASGATLLGGGGGGGAFSPASAGGSRIGPVPPLGGGLGAAAPPPGAGGGGGKGTVFGAGSAPAPHADLSHALWLHSALSGHRRRVREPDGAALFVVPAFGSLSEATGSCEGTTHTQRMTAAANALRASPHWMKAKERHVVFAGSSSEDRLPLGDLGAVLSKGNAIGLCTSRTYCSARFAKRAEVPMLPLLSLMDPKLPGKLGGELCAKGSQSDGGGKRRRTLLFFRGAHGTSTPAQQRARAAVGAQVAGAERGYQVYDGRRVERHSRRRCAPEARPKRLEQQGRAHAVQRGGGCVWHAALGLLRPASRRGQQPRQAACRRGCGGVRASADWRHTPAATRGLPQISRFYRARARGRVPSLPQGRRCRGAREGGAEAARAAARTLARAAGAATRQRRVAPRDVAHKGSRPRTAAGGACLLPKNARELPSVRGRRHGIARRGLMESWAPIAAPGCGSSGSLARTTRLRNNQRTERKCGHLKVFCKEKRVVGGGPALIP